MELVVKKHYLENISLIVRKDEKSMIDVIPSGQLIN